MFDEPMNHVDEHVDLIKEKGWEDVRSNERAAFFDAHTKPHLKHPKRMSTHTLPQQPGLWGAQVTLLFPSLCNATLSVIFVATIV
jgi:hypothetical protein